MMRLKGKVLSAIMAMFIMVMCIPVMAEPESGVSTRTDLTDLIVQQVLSTGETKDVVLTPAFSANITEYNTTLDADCTKLQVTAIAADASSTTTVNWPDMDKGDNKTWVDVKAPDGTKKAYTIYSVVPEINEPKEDESPKPKESPTPKEDEADVANEDTIEPEYEYKKIIRVADNRKVYTVVDAEDTSSIPKGYSETTLTIRKKEVRAWSTNAGSPFYLLYALDPDGNLDLFSYDKEQKTIQRFNRIDFSNSSIDVEAIDKVQKELDDTKESLSKKNTLKLKVIILMIVILIIFIFVIMNLIVKIKDLTSLSDDDDEYDDEEEIKIERKAAPIGKRRRKVYDDEEGEYDDDLESLYNDEDVKTPEPRTVKKPVRSALVVPQREVLRADDEYDFADLNIDLTDSILEELTKTSQDLERSSRTIDGNTGYSAEDETPLDMPNFNTSNLPNPNRFKIEIPNEEDDDDFEFFDFND